METILITGGAGFIGSHLATLLLERGYKVRGLDNLHPQVHGFGSRRPQYLDPQVELMVGDVRDVDTLRAALAGVQAVFHLAARVGVGQSMYQVNEYVSANSLGVGSLLQVLATEHHTVPKLLIASSMSVYGEGAYHCTACGPVPPGLRSEQQLAARQWDLACPRCGRELLPEQTGENLLLGPTSIYAITKRDQEDLALCFGRACHLPTVALRFFNVYGPHQALSNPYTGVIAIFIARLLAGRRPIVFEDGRQRRDFVHVHDVVRACLLALESDQADYQALNVGSGHWLDLLGLLNVLRREMGEATPKPEIVGRYRTGDIRHCYADIDRIQQLLGYQPSVSIEAGLHETVTWMRSQPFQDRLDEALRALETRNLLH